MIDTSPINHDTRFAGIGLLPGPAGAFLLPPARAEDAEALARGAFTDLPESWAFFAELAEGREPALDDPFNRAVMSGDPDALAPFLDDADPTVRAHAGAVTFRLGGNAEPGAPDESLDPRVAAFILGTLAHESGDVEQLRQAADLTRSISPCAAARYLGEGAAIAAPNQRTLLDHQQAAELLYGLAFESLRGELLMHAADVLMTLGSERPPLLQQAVILLQRATQALPRRTNPVAFAVCHMNIAVAYLSMPMGEHSGKLRGAIAVQSLREALEILTPEGQPELWESATLNLANALQHLPSAHPGQNLVESVSLYDSVLERRVERTPARARTLASRANALAHLGKLDEAKPMLAEARGIFAEAGDADGLSGIDAIADEMVACVERAKESDRG